MAECETENRDNHFDEHCPAGKVNSNEENGKKGKEKLDIASLPPPVSGDFNKTWSPSSVGFGSDDDDDCLLRRDSLDCVGSSDCTQPLVVECDSVLSSQVQQQQQQQQQQHDTKAAYNTMSHLHCNNIDKTSSTNDDIRNTSNNNTTTSTTTPQSPSPSPSPSPPPPPATTAAAAAKASATMITTTKAADEDSWSEDEHGGYVDTRAFATSPETSICAVSSTVEDDDEKDCRTVSSSLSADRPVVAGRCETFPEDHENSLVLPASSTLTAELLQKEDLYIGRDAENQRKKLKSSVAELLLSSPTSCTDYGNSTHSNEAVTLDNSSAKKKKNIDGGTDKFQSSIHQSDNVSGMVSKSSSMGSTPKQFRNNEIISNSKGDTTDGSEKGKEGLESGYVRIADALEESFSNINHDQFEAKLFNAITSKPSRNNNNGPQVELAFKENIREKSVNVMDGKEQNNLNSDMQEASVLTIEGETSSTCVPMSSTVSKNSATIVIKEQSSPLDFSKFQECKSSMEEKPNNMEVTADVNNSGSIDESGMSANTNANNSNKPETTADSKKVTSNGERKRKFCEPLLSVIEKATKNFSVNISTKLDAITTTTSTITSVAKCPKISSDSPNKSDSHSISASPLLTLRTPTINSLVSSSSSSLSSSPSPSSSSPSLTFSPPLIATSSSPPPLQPPAPLPNAASSSVLSSGKSGLVETILSYDNGLYACSHCSFSGKQSAFEDHLFSHMENYAFKCDECTSEFKSPSQWQQHVLFRHKGQHHLPKYMSLLIKEIRASNDQKLNFQCPEASRSPTKHRQTHPADPGGQISKSNSEPFSVTNNTDPSQSPKQFSDKHRAFCKDLEVTFVSNEYICLQCAKKSKDKEIFRFHLWTHTHSAESSYCCCTTLTRESCEVVANILQLVTDTNTLTESEDGAKKTVVICRIRKSDLKLETISKMASEVKNLSAALPLLVGAEVKNSLCSSKSDQTTEHSISSLKDDTDKNLKQTGGAANKDAKFSGNCKKKDIQEFKETVIVENPLRAGTHLQKVLKTSLADQGCEKIPDLKSISVTQIENNTSSGKMVDESRTSKVSKKENPDFAVNFSLVKVKSEQPDEEYLLEDINRKIMNIKKEVKEFTALTNMLCDISSSDGSLLDLKKELSDDQDMALDLKISSPPSLSSSNIYKDSSASSSFSSFANDSLSLSMTVNAAENLSATGENHAVVGMDKDLKGAFYKCGFNGCGFASMNSTQFRAHLETAHKYVSSYPCAHCGHVAPSEDNLLRHMQTHTNTKIFLLFKCAFAGCRFGTNLIHEFRDHNEIFHKDEKTCSCLNCKQVFVELSELLNHLRTNLLKFIQCPHCSVKDRNRRAVLNHISEAHPGKPKQIVVTSQVVCQEKQTGGMADSKALLAEHANSLQLAPFPSKNDIEYLETKLKPKELLSALHLTNDMYPFSKTFSAISDSKNHSSTLPKNQYSCKLCKYTTSQSPLLENHVRNYHPSFLGEYIARHIGKGSTKSSLTSSESKQKLGIADLETASPVPKNSNQEKSPEEQPFVNKAIAKACCHLCPVAYKHVQQLKTHVRVKHRECQLLNFLKCVHCNAKSTSKEYLVSSCKKRHPKKEFHFTHIQEVLNSNKNESEMLDLIVNPSRQEYNSGRRCEHGNLSSCFQCELKNSNSSNDWKVPLFKDQSYESNMTDSVKPFVCKVFKNMVRPTKSVNQSPILTVPSAKGSLQKNTTKSKSSSEKKSAASTLDTDFSSTLPPCEIGSQTLDSKLSVLYTRNRKWNRCKCCQFTTDHVATIHHHILDCHLKLYLWSCPYCELRSIKKQNIIQHCLHFHENKKPGAKFESQDWNKDIRNILNLLPKDTSASTFTKQTFIISGPSSETPNCYRLATEPLTIPTSLTKPNRPTVVKLSNGVYKCSVCSTKGFVEWQVQKHIETEHSSELKASGANGSGSSIVLDFGKQTSGNSTDVSKDIPRTGTKQIPEGSVKYLEAQPEDIELQNLSNPSSKDEEMKAMARKIIEVSAGVLQCPFCSYKSRLRTCVKCHIWSQHMMLKRKRCKHCSFASWFDNGIEAHMATEHPRLCFGGQTTKAGYTVLVEEPDGTWKEMAVNFVRSSKEDVAFRKRPISKESESNSKNNCSNKKAKKAIINSSTSKALSIYTSDSSSQLPSNPDDSAKNQNTSEVLNLSKSGSSSVELKVSKPNALMSSKSQKTSLQSSLKTNKTMKPALVISPKFFKMSKSGALNLSKSATKAELTGSTPISAAKPSVINVPKFKASDPLKYQRDAKKMDEDPYESSGSGNSNGSRGGGHRSYYWSGEGKSGTSIMSLVKGSRDKNRPSQVSSSSSSNSSSSNNNSSGSSSSTRKAMPDSLITINTRMEEMCVREFDENLMQYTFTCTICSYRSTNRTTFNSHTYSHKPPAFKCGYCPFRANPRCRVTAHIRKYHKEPLIKIINLSSTPKRAIDKVPSLTKEEATALAQQRKLKILEKGKDLEDDNERRKSLTIGVDAHKSDKINNNNSNSNKNNNTNYINNNNNNNSNNGNVIGNDNSNKNLMMMMMKKKKKKNNIIIGGSNNNVTSIGSENESDGISDSSLDDFGSGPYGMDYNDDEEFDNSLDGSDHEEEEEEEEDLYSSLTFCCNACSFRTSDIDRFTKHTSLHNFFTHGMKVACMDCPFSTNHIVQYEEHISRHIEGFLFYCGCCSFSSVEEQEVREHSLKKHPDRVISIEISPSPPSSLSTKWSPVDLDPFVELTDFLAMDCERFYNLISHHGVTMVDLKSTAVSYEDLNVKSSSEDEDDIDDDDDDDEGEERVLSRCDLDSLLDDVDENDGSADGDDRVVEKVKTKAKGTSNDEDAVAMEIEDREDDDDLVPPMSHEELKVKDSAKQTSPTLASYDIEGSENADDSHRLDVSDQEDRIDDVDDVDVDVVDVDDGDGGGGVSDDNDGQNVNDDVDDDDDDVDGGLVVGDDEDEDAVHNDHHQDDSVDAYGDVDDDDVDDGGVGCDDDIDDDVDDDDINLVSVVRDERHKLDLNSSPPGDNVKQHLPPPPPPNTGSNNDDDDYVVDDDDDDDVDINDDNDEGAEADNDDDDDDDDDDDGVVHEDDDVIAHHADAAHTVDDSKDGEDGVFRICNDDDDDDDDEFDAIVNKKKKEDMMKRRNKNNKMNNLETDEDDDIVNNDGGDNDGDDNYADDDDDDDDVMKTVNNNSNDIDDIGIADDVYADDDDVGVDGGDVDDDDDDDDYDDDANNSNRSNTNDCIKLTFKNIGHRERVIETNSVQGLLNTDEHDDDDDNDDDDDDDDDDDGGDDDDDASLSLVASESEKKSSYLKRKYSRNSRNANNIDDGDLSSSVSKETNCSGNNTRS